MKPITMTGDSPAKIIAGLKTMTRRLVKPQPDAIHDGEPYWFVGGYRAGEYRATGNVLHKAANPIRCPYGKPGDKLWVKEKWGYIDFENGADFNAAESAIAYWASGEQIPIKNRWRHQRYMPRWASRIWLEITSVRMERLQDISNDDARAEGVLPAYAGQCVSLGHPFNALPLFRELWGHINGSGSWDANPWVWVIGFKQIKEGTK